MRFAAIRPRPVSILMALSLAGLGQGFNCPAEAQQADVEPQDRARILEVAREIMTAAGTCALITTDGAGRAHARAMDAFEPDEDFVVWMGTNPRTRKVAQIRTDPRVTLYYFDPGSQAYVSLGGVAEMVDDPEEKAVRFKPAWEAFYPDREAGYALIRVRPEWIEVVSEGHGVTGDETTWRPPRVTFPPELGATSGR